MVYISPIYQPTIYNLNEVASTNSYAQQLVQQQQAAHGAIIMAQQQSEGRGQRGNTWQSQYGKDLLVSIVLLHHNNEAHHQFVLNMAIAQAVHAFIHNKCPEAAIKWSNDILIHDAKIAGILIENMWQGSQWYASIVGIGININSIYAFDGTRTSLLQCMGEELPLTVALQELITEINNSLSLLNTSSQSVVNYYNSNLWRRHQLVRVLINGNIILAHLMGVAANGALQLHFKDGTQQGYAFGQAKLIIE
jgi:BirA family transcriptional regulator, biotin operon repressor / biotin---[acetyl-CoA-carboxylase] ligase